MATLTVCVLALAPVYLVAACWGGVEMELGQWVMLFAVHLLAVPSFVLIGLTLGFSLSANGAVAVSNIIFLTFSTLGGLWAPVSVFPDFLKAIAFALPSYHFGELALAVAGAAGEHTPTINLFVALGMTVLFAFAAITAWSRQQ